MHELAVCQQLLSQVKDIAAENQATTVDLIRVSVGPLSGVEPALLEQAFTIARSGTIAEQAELDIDRPAVTVSCRSCGTESKTTPNMLLCAACGDWKVDVLHGTELMLMSVELSGLPETAPAGESDTESEKEAEYV